MHHQKILLFPVGREVTEEKKEEEEVVMENIMKKTRKEDEEEEVEAGEVLKTIETVEGKGGVTRLVEEEEAHEE